MIPQHYIQWTMIWLVFSTRCHKRNLWKQWYTVLVRDWCNQYGKDVVQVEVNKSNFHQHNITAGRPNRNKKNNRFGSKIYPWLSSRVLIRVFFKHWGKFSNNIEEQELVIKFHQWCQTLQLRWLNEPGTHVELASEFWIGIWKCWSFPMLKVELRLWILNSENLK